ncbi:calcyclin-binding protein [Halyomorpha halys]|uniref:calcyclin-binding protein n=1 Tax=Halyomorpha halys TaxID=286706 RepID=UPI0006D4D184|nr:calcyclin-binding protein [Halyomorpha halys]
MSSTKISELKSDVEELSKFMNLTTRPKVKEILSLEVRKIETEILKLKELNNSSNEMQSGVPTRAQSSAGSRCYDVKLTNYAWDQSDKFVKLFVTLKNVQSLESEQIFCKFSARSVELRVNGLDNRNYFLVINNLLNDIDESKSHWKVKTDMVIVYLSKSQSVDWKHLTLSEQKLKDAQKKDIDDMNPNEDPSQGLMNLMKKMYTEGDDDMKRTIAKAWCEGREKGMNTLD